MIHFTKSKKWENYTISFYETLNLYYVEKNIDYSSEIWETDEGLVNDKGEWIYRSNAEDVHIGLSHTWYASKVGQELLKQINHWKIIKNIGTEKQDKCKITIHCYKNGQVEELFQELFIVDAQTISPNELVLKTVANENQLKRNGIITVKIVNTDTLSVTDVIETRYFEDRLFNNQLITYEVFGSHFLFSIKTENRKLDTNENKQDIFQMFKNNGEKLFDFETVTGESGELTWFEPSKSGYGITYKLLDRNASNQCECLIDRFGNFYGEFYRISGTNPYMGVKSATKYPKFINGKILCLTLPNEAKISFLVFIDRKANKIETEFQCPWIHSMLFKRCALVNDEKYFGKKGLVVVDKNNLVRLIDFEGNIISNSITDEYKGAGYEYAKFFIEQSGK